MRTVSQRQFFRESLTGNSISRSLRVLRRFRRADNYSRYLQKLQNIVILTYIRFSFAAVCHFTPTFSAFASTDEAHPTAVDLFT